jgi:hypothetical protein
MTEKAERCIDAHEQRLVGDRVEIGAEFGLPAESACEKSVGCIGQAGDKKDDKRGEK